MDHGTGTHVSIAKGCISQFPATAIIATATNNGPSSNDLDRIIQHAAGGMQYHNQVKPYKNIACSDSIVAQQIRVHDGGFEKVIFVIDNNNLPLQEIILAGLTRAEKMGIPDVAIPILRDQPNSLEEIRTGIDKFLATGPKVLRNITFVNGNNRRTPLVKKAFAKYLAKASSPHYKL